MTPQILAPKRGTVDPTTLKPNPLSDRPQTQFIQVEPSHDQNKGLRLHRYIIPLTFTYADIPTCTAAGGAGGGAGATVSLPQIPATCRVVCGWFETKTAWVNDAGTQEIDGVYLNTDAMIADGNITAAAGVIEFDATAVPVKYAVLVTPKVYFTGLDTVAYTAGEGVLYVEVISYFEA